MLLTASDFAAEGESKSILPDENLASAVRQFVFEKRDNAEPLVEGDLASIAIIQAPDKGIRSLAGLEKAVSPASLDIGLNDVTDLSPLTGMDRLQFLNAGRNEIQDLSPLAPVTALQYLELSANRIRDLKPLAGLTNMSALYLSTNYISDITPLSGMKKLSSLYLQNNALRSIKGIEELRGLNSLNLSGNEISDLTPLKELNNLYYLFLENNRIEDLGTLVEMAENDKEGRFAPFLNLYLAGNPLSDKAKNEQIPRLKELGVRVKSS